MKVNMRDRVSAATNTALMAASYVIGLLAVLSGTKTLTSVDDDAVAPIMQKLEANDMMWMNPEVDALSEAYTDAAAEVNRDVREMTDVRSGSRGQVEPEAEEPYRVQPISAEEMNEMKNVSTEEQVQAFGSDRPSDEPESPMDENAVPFGDIFDRLEAELVPSMDGMKDVMVSDDIREWHNRCTFIIAPPFTRDMIRSYVIAFTGKYEGVFDKRFDTMCGHAFSSAMDEEIAFNTFTSVYPTVMNEELDRGLTSGFMYMVVGRDLAHVVHPSRSRARSARCSSPGSGMGSRSTPGPRRSVARRRWQSPAEGYWLTC